MAKERFILMSGANLMWTVSDVASGVSIEFREGLFNETHNVRVPDSMQGCDAMKLAKIMCEIGDWMAENHADVAVCADWRARCSVVRKLSNDNYWLAMAAATYSLLVTDQDADNAACMLCAEVCDWLDDMKTVDLTAAEGENLKGVLSELTDSEAWEVFRIVHVFWTYHKADCDIHQWALDVTWWPAWLPDSLKMADESEEDDIIDEI